MCIENKIPMNIEAIITLKALITKGSISFETFSPNIKDIETNNENKNIERCPIKMYFLIMLICLKLKSFKLF